MKNLRNLPNFDLNWVMEFALMEDFITLQLPINLPIEVIVKPATVDFITNKASMFIQIINVKNYV